MSGKISPKKNSVDVFQVPKEMHVHICTVHVSNVLLRLKDCGFVLAMVEAGSGEESAGDPPPAKRARRKTKQYNKEEVQKFVKEELTALCEKYKRNKPESKVFTESSIFKCLKDTTRVITKENSEIKALTVCLFPERFLNENPKKLSQTYGTDKAAKRAKDRVVELINYILFNSNQPWLENPEFDPDKLYLDKKHIDVLISVLTHCAKLKLINPNFREIANILCDDYEGYTINELIENANLTTLLPKGTRSTIGIKAKTKICEEKRIGRYDFTNNHRKVHHDYLPDPVLKYRIDEIEIVKDCIIEEARKQWDNDKFLPKRLL